PRAVPDESMQSKQVATWDCVWLGSYPQTEVTSADPLYGVLRSADWDESDDATVGGERYRRISKSDATYSGWWSDDGYGSAAYRYFRYEPVKWRVLEVYGATALAVADVALDCQRYNANDAGVTWETSGIRYWLNGYGASANQSGTDFSGRGFLDVAFSPAERGAILTTDVANKANTQYNTDGGNDTTDRVFLLSEAEVYDTSHGFVSSCDTDDEARRCKPSGYARAMGAWRPTSVGNCCWWLRSPGLYAYCAAYVYSDGYVLRHGGNVNNGSDAVRPALNLDLTSAHLLAAGTVSSDGVERAPITSVALVASSYAYDGKAKEPSATVRAGDDVVPESGYDVAYENNVDAGTATVTVTGRGGYVGSATATFQILPASLSGATVTGVVDKAYTGKAQTQSPTVEVAGRTLREGADYTLSYEDNVKVGTATVTVTGVGNYEGTTQVTFRIVAASLSGAAVSGVSNKTYTGKPRTQAPTVRVGGRTLKKGTDYKLSYEDNVKAGTATVTVTGVGNYKGSVKKTFKIVKAANPMRVRAVKRAAKASKAKGSAQVVARPIKFTKKAKGEVTYARVAKGSSKLLSVNKRTGKVTVAKGTKKGTYKIRIKVTAKGDANYKKATKTVTCTVVVK
ncbi:MAG: DUF6273 domain-containing protein, partial [Coriobacteriales bacterium]|nr:DUF6273 domain-containing protein [Coriobacteriales bacterium]